MATLQTTAVTGSLTVTGQLIAQSLNVQQVTSSIVYSSGSNIFGKLVTDVQQLTGSLRVTGSGEHWVMGGSVGIGTISPTSKLDVAGNIRTTGTLMVSGSEATIHNISNGPAVLTLSTYYTGGQTWNGRIVSDYYGQQYTSSLYHGMSFVGGRAGVDNFRWFDSSYNELMTLRESGNLVLGGGTNPSENWWRLYIAGSTSGSIYVASGVSYFGGNVGIGTTSPSHKLTVTSGNVAIESGNLYLSSSAFIHFDYGISNSYSILKSSTALTFNTAGSFVFSGGSVGINTTSPVAMLHLENSNSTYTSPANNNVPTIYVNNLNSTTSTAHAIVAMRTYGVSGGNPFVSWDINGIIGWSMGIDNADSDKLKIANNWSDLTSNTRVTITTGGNVGIGTTSPSSLLHVSQSGNGATTTLILSDNARQLKLGRDQIQAYDLGGSATTMFISPDANIYMNNSSGFTYFGGNIGIGTTSPGQALTLGANKNIRLDWGGGTDTTFEMFYDSDFKQGITFQGNARKMTIHNYSGDTTDTTITLHNGAVGVGVTTPIAKLQIGSNTFTGANGIDSNSRIGMMLNGSLTSYVYASTYNDPTYPDYGMVFIHGPNTSNYNVWSISPDGPAKGSGLHLIYQSGSTNIHNQTPKVSFIGSSGNVGIGSTSPAYKLDVAGTIQSTGGIINGILVINRNTTGLRLNRDAVTNYNGIYYATANADKWFVGMRENLSSNNHIHYSEALGADVLTLNQTSGSATFISSVAATQFTSQGGRGTSYGYQLPDWQIYNTTSGNALAFSNYTSDLLYITSGGNVGIGTTSPGAKLQVYGSMQIYAGSSGNSDPLCFGAETGTSKKAIFLETFWMVYQGHDNEGHKFRSVNAGGSYTDDMTITGGGNVGIGTTSPAYKLEVSGGNIAYKPSVGGNLRLGDDETYGTSGTGRYITVGFGSMANGGNRIFAHNTGQDGIFIASATGTGIFFRVNGGASDNVSITSAGNVGIGTTSPAYKLEVAGTIGIGGNTIPIANNTYTLGGGSNKFSQIWGARFFADDGSAGSPSYTFAGDQDSGFFKPGDGALATTINGVERMRVNGGNVGINTTSPSYRLHVRSTDAADIAKFSGDQGFDGASRVYITNDASIHGRTNLVLTGRLDNGNDGFSFGTNNRNGITFNTNLGGAQGATGTEKYSIQLEGNSGTLYFQSSGSSAASRTGIAFTQDSNVGIGTVTPANKLEVDGGSSAVTLRISTTNTGAGVASLILANSTKSSFNDGVKISHGGGYTAVTDLNGTNIMTWDLSNTRVGINATSLVGKFQVGNNTFSGGNGTYANDRIGAIVNGSLTSYVYASTYNDATYPDYGFVFMHGTNTSNYNVWSISPDGPAAGSGLHFIYQANSTNIHSQTPKVSFIGSTGRVGIGTKSPAIALHIENANSTYTSPGNNDVPSIYLNNTNGSSTSAHSILTLRTYTGGGGNPFISFDINGVQGYAMGIDNADSDKFKINYGWSTLTSDTKITLTVGGNVGIGSTSPAYKLDVDGTIRATADIIAYSDARVKENVNTITDALTKVTSLRGVSYTRKDTDDKSEKVGVIAQEVLEVLPQVVQQDTEGNYSVAYGNIVGVLIEAIKELKAEIDILKNK